MTHHWILTVVSVGGALFALAGGAPMSAALCGVIALAYAEHLIRDVGKL